MNLYLKSTKTKKRRFSRGVSSVCREFMKICLFMCCLLLYRNGHFRNKDKVFLAFIPLVVFDGYVVASV